jgi:hypothetical protein
MSLMSLLKDLFSSPEKEEKKEEIKKINFEELENLIRDKKEQLENEEKSILELINNRVLQCVQEIKEEINVLEAVDLNKRKEKEKIKLIVEENLKNYILYLKNVVEDLGNLDKRNPEGLRKRIDQILFEFEKKSFKSYERATILVGKEMAATKNTIKSFFREIENLVGSDKTLIEKSESIKNIKENKNKIENMKSALLENEVKIKDLKHKINGLLEDKKNTEENVEKIKFTDRYKNFLKSAEEKNNKLADLDKEKQKAKELIDFKFLAKNFHTDEKKMKIIKENRDNFNYTFWKDEGKNILALLNGSNINTENLSNKIKDILNEQEKIEGVLVDEDPIKVHKKKLEDINSDLKELENKNLELNGKNEKLENNVEKMIDSLNQDLKKLNVEIAR